MSYIASQNAPTDYYTQYNLADALRNKGDYSEALKIFEKIDQIVDSNELTKVDMLQLAFSRAHCLARLGYPVIDVQQIIETIHNAFKEIPAS